MDAKTEQSGRDRNHKILFLDPGKTTGWALFDALGKFLDYGQLLGLDKLQEQLTIWLGDTGPGEFISEVYYEDYNLRNDKTRNMTQHQKEGHQVTLQAIGIIKMACMMSQRKVEKVSVQQKHVGYKQGNIPKATNHKDSHWRDAAAIGYAHFVRAGILKVKREPFDPEKE